MIAHYQWNATFFPFFFLFKGILPVDFENLLHFFLDKRPSVTTSNKIISILPYSFLESFLVITDVSESKFLAVGDTGFEV